MKSCTYLDPRQRERCTECGKGNDLCVCGNPNELAHERLTTPTGKFLQFVAIAEGDVGSNRHLFEQLVESVAAVGVKLVRHDNDRSASPEEIYKALVRVAALATRLANEGTDEYAYP